MESKQLSSNLESFSEWQVAVVGAGIRLPQASDVPAFSDMLRAGRSGIVDLGTVRPDGAEISRPAGYVPVGGYLGGAGRFDAAYFNISPGEARVIDPQHRLFLQCCAEALEDAGYDARSVGGQLKVGVFGGSGMALYSGQGIKDYASEQILRGRGVLPPLAPLQGALSTYPDHMCTRVSHKLGLTGPSIGVQTACSSALVAIHLAAQSILLGECDMALAGAMSIHFPLNEGYAAMDGGVLSPDGVCRPFDVAANGTVGGSGGGVFVLRRLRDAVKAGDPVYGVLRGSAINNDGGDRAGYMTPSVSGQERVLRSALSAAELDPSQISLVEAHGTGTSLGDAIEVKALRSVYGVQGSRCAVGSVKPNVGHLDAAAGVPGVLKALLSLRDGSIVPTLNHQDPVDGLRGETRLYVPTEPEDWGDHPRHAAVTSLGGGGTNAHAIFDASPFVQQGHPVSTDSGPYVLRVSARTDGEWESAVSRWAAQLHEQPHDAGALCTTANTVRSQQSTSMWFAGSSATELVDALARATAASRPAGAPARVVFAFSGQGEDPWPMLSDLCASSADARQFVSECQDLASRLAGAPISLLDVEPGEADVVATNVAHLVLQMCLVSRWSRAGVSPDLVMGHSMGEIAAAWAAGILSDEHALIIVVERAKLAQQMQPGAMLAVLGASAEVSAALARIGGTAEIAAVNSPFSVTIVGDQESIDAVEDALREDFPVARISSTHAYHSRLVEPIQKAYGEMLSGVDFRAARVPAVSSAVPDEDVDMACSGYWVNQVRVPVQFEVAARKALREGDLVLEIGESASLVAHLQTLPVPLHLVPSLQRGMSAAAGLAQAATLLANSGADVDVESFGTRNPRRGHAPSSLVEGDELWVVGDGHSTPEDVVPEVPVYPEASGTWVTHPVWRPAAAQQAPAVVEQPQTWLVLGAEGDDRRERWTNALDGAESCSWDHVKARVAELPQDVAAAVLLVAPRFHDVTELWVFTARLRDALLAVAATRKLRLVLAAGDEADPLQSALAVGLRTLANERGADTVSVVFTDEPSQVCRTIATLGQGEFSLVGGKLCERVSEVVAPTDPVTCDPDRTYVVSGGFGGVGLYLAEKMVALGARHLVLIGRTAPGVATRRRVEALRSAGVDVVSAFVDVSDPVAVSGLADRFAVTLPPVAGVVHAAGILRDSTAVNVTVEDLEHVWRPKVEGAKNLATAFGPDLDFFMTCSSIVVSSVQFGRTAYAMANAAMEKAVSSVPTHVSVRWAPWRGTGMSAAADDVKHLNVGFEAMEPQAALEAFEGLLGAAGTVAVEVGRSQVADSVLAADERPAQSGSTPVKSLEDVVTVLVEGVAKVCGYEPDDIDCEVPFADLGVDSLDGLMLRENLLEELGIRLPVTFTYDFPTVASLAEELVRLQGDAS
ncbi:MAG: SDR family NAD(P)-dependent oxidoreductase [Bifidobacteriaceae bacterium]|jgi:acyl transferase domain-containing protein/acyl carrier protein|nr:SDR family NAD(P)-dependent oxidoreductase [Bifidobacteriaceae bacterium]